MFKSLLLLACASLVQAADRPNVLWIYVDDMSDWLGCCGDTLAQTPNIDALAAGGIRFTNAFMPSPVCSTTRSAIITGTMQTTLGLHQHRTMVKAPLPTDVLTVPELFRAAGYTTFNEAKDDYNFTRKRSLLYSPDFVRPGYRSHLKGSDLKWLEQLRGKQFFGQIQLAGGKTGGETGAKYPAESRFVDSAVHVPAYYPNTRVFRNAISRHYEQIAQTDEQVGAIVAALKEYELWDNTVVFFFTDHGCPLPRSKQFLYEAGLRVPLIVRGPSPAEHLSGESTTRTDLVSGIDIAATSLALAGIPVPPHMEARDFLSSGGTPRDHVIGARDRLGVAVDRIRSVRTNEFRYIKNFHTDRSLYQLQYRQDYATFRDLRQLLAAGNLSTLQASYHDSKLRPAEELYALANDPEQVNNLAGDPEFASVLAEHRDMLSRWVSETDDQGQYPESQRSLKLVYDQAKGKVASPEFDFSRK